jgi:hypothetical protein
MNVLVKSSAALAVTSAAMSAEIFSSDDHVFAAIERHRQAHKAFVEAATAADEASTGTTALKQPPKVCIGFHKKGAFRGQPPVRTAVTRSLGLLMVKRSRFTLIASKVSRGMFQKICVIQIERSGFLRKRLNWKNNCKRRRKASLPSQSKHCPRPATWRLRRCGTWWGRFPPPQTASWLYFRMCAQTTLTEHFSTTNIGKCSRGRSSVQSAPWRGCLSRRSAADWRVS